MEEIRVEIVKQWQKGNQAITTSKNNIPRNWNANAFNKQSPNHNATDVRNVIKIIKKIEIIKLIYELK